MYEYKIKLIVKSNVKDEDKFREAFFDVLDGRMESDHAHKHGIICDSYEEGIEKRKLKKVY